MRKLDPACKFIALLVPTFFLAAKPNALWNLAVFAVCFLLLFFSRVRRLLMHNTVLFDKAMFWMAPEVERRLK